VATDWVPLMGYDDNTQLCGVGETTFELMDPANWNALSQTLGTVEDENRVYKILRIVGYWTLTVGPNAPIRGYAVVRAWPGFQQQNFATLSIPGRVSTPDNTQLSETQRSSNEKWWWERVVPWQDVAVDSTDRWDRASSLAHPYSYMADFKPNMWMGDSFSPAVTIANYTSQDILWFHRWRALVAY